MNLAHVLTIAIGAALAYAGATLGNDALLALGASLCGGAAGNAAPSRGKKTP